MHFAVSSELSWLVPCHPEEKLQTAPQSSATMWFPEGSLARLSNRFGLKISPFSCQKDQLWPRLTPNCETKLCSSFEPRTRERVQTDTGGQKKECVTLKCNKERELNYSSQGFFILLTENRAYLTHKCTSARDSQAVLLFSLFVPNAIQNQEPPCFWNCFTMRYQGFFFLWAHSTWWLNGCAVRGTHLRQHISSGIHYRSIHTDACLLKA